MSFHKLGQQDLFVLWIDVPGPESTISVTIFGPFDHGGSGGWDLCLLT